MNTQSGELRPVEGYTGIQHVGDFYWSYDNVGQLYFNALLPGKAFMGEIEDVAFCSIPVRLEEDSQAWHWDGNRDRPTLQPSLYLHDHWHGFIRAGRFESC